MSTVLAPGAFTTTDPSAPATSLAYGVGQEVIDLAVALAPIAVPFVFAMTAIGWVLAKFGLRGPSGLDRALVGEAVSGTHTCGDCGKHIPARHGFICRECNPDDGVVRRSTRSRRAHDDAGHSRAQCHDPAMHAYNCR